MCLFTAMTGSKLSCLRHDLYSCKKGTLSIKGYVAKFQTTCALIEASGSRISEAEKVKIILAGLPLDFDAVITLASFLSEPLPLQRLIDVLLEYENRQICAIHEVSLHTNLLEFGPSQFGDQMCGGRPPSGGCGRGFRFRVQCQIYG